MRKYFKHIILLSIDDLRYDALSAESDSVYMNRYELAQSRNTPQLDNIYEQAATFRQCRSTAVFTPPSHASILSGLNPIRHGVRVFFPSQLSPDSPTLFNLLKQSNFQTLSSIDYPFCFYPQRIIQPESDMIEKDDETILRAFEKSAQEGDRTFLFMHMSNVHFPYGLSYPPVSEADQARLSAYFALAKGVGIRTSKSLENKIRKSLSFSGSLLDQIHKKLIEKNIAENTFMPCYVSGVNQFDRSRFRELFNRIRKLKSLKDILVVITSDHGEMGQKVKGGNTFFGHGLHLAEEATRVPLMFWNPYRLDPSKSETPVSSTDITPTILELCGIRTKLSFDGQSLARMVLSKKETAPSECFAESWQHPSDFFKKFYSILRIFGDEFPQPDKLKRFFPPITLFQQTIRSGNYKLVKYFGAGRNQFSLFNTKTDPFESNNLLNYEFYNSCLLDQSIRNAGMIKLPDYGNIAKALKERLSTLNTPPDRSQKQKRFVKNIKVTDLAERMKGLGYLP